MTKKKITIAIVALALICAIAIGGTVAYLTTEANSGDGITNTFTSGNGLVIDPKDESGDKATFEIIEHGIKTNADGSLSLDTDNDAAATGNTYKILPGIDLPKDPAVNIVGKSDEAAYLFLEVDENLTDGIYETYALETVWQPLKDKGEQITGKNGGLVYYYAAKAGDAAPDTTATILKAADDATENLNINIIKDKKLTVKSDADLTKLPDGSEGNPSDTLNFYAYLAQSAGFTDAVEAFTTCFLAAESN